MHYCLLFGRFWMAGTLSIIICFVDIYGIMALFESAPLEMKGGGLLILKPYI